MWRATCPGRSHHSSNSCSWMRPSHHSCSCSTKGDGARGLEHNFFVRQKAFAALSTHCERHPPSRAAGIQSLWHANAGHPFDFGSPLNVSVQTGGKTRNLSTLGISAKPPFSPVGLGNPGNGPDEVSMGGIVVLTPSPEKGVNSGGKKNKGRGIFIM